ncbi:MAG TPA: universal stress protein [Acidimicrobiales bacterium]|nr:universal stress protein [Acidimicrobiales bacterium]
MSDTMGSSAGTSHSAVPVVHLAGGRASSPAKAVLVVGFDRSAASLAALGKAAQIGGLLGAELHVVHAVDLADYPVDPDADDWEEQAATSLEEERQLVSATLAGYPSGWTYLAPRAEPGEALRRIADQVDALMIVVGVRSHGWRHLLDRLGGPSVSHRLIGHCHRPVLVVGFHQAT